MEPKEAEKEKLKIKREIYVKIREWEKADKIQKTSIVIDDIQAYIFNA